MNTELNTKIEVRTTHQRKQLIKDAAELEGQSMTDFIMSVAQERLAHYASLAVNMHDFNRMLDILDNPPEPNTYLKQSMKKLKGAGTTFELQHREM
jgi:uncharacterized protein (DUF1778 family)